MEQPVNHFQHIQLLSQTFSWYCSSSLATEFLCSACAGDAFLVVTGSAKIKIYDRDGRELGESLQGDMYIRDMKNTKGHVSPCLNGQWHPHNKSVLNAPTLGPFRFGT